MKSNKFAEIGNLVQVIGCLYNKPKLFEHDDKYKFNKHDKICYQNNYPD